MPPLKPELHCLRCLHCLRPPATHIPIAAPAALCCNVLAAPARLLPRGLWERCMIGARYFWSTGCWLQSTLHDRLLALHHASLKAFHD